MTEQIPTDDIRNDARRVLSRLLLVDIPLRERVRRLAEYVLAHHPEECQLSAEWDRVRRAYGLTTEEVFGRDVNEYHSIYLQKFHGRPACEGQRVRASDPRSDGE